MNKEQVKNVLIDPALKEGEQLVGFFQAQFMPPMWMFALLGSGASIGMRSFFVAITRQGIHLHKLDFFGRKSESSLAYDWSEVESIKLGKKGLLEQPLSLVFKNGKKITLKAQVKGVPGLITLDEATTAFIKDRSAVRAA